MSRKLFLHVVLLIAMLGVIPILATPAKIVAMPMRWQTSLVDQGRRFTDVSMAIGDDGRIHIAYGGGQLFYAVWNGLGWETRTIETIEGGTGYGCSLALDDIGNPAIAYVASDSGYQQDVKYARLEGSQWLVSTVANDAASDYVSLHFDAMGKAGIAYSSSSGLGFARWDGVSWQTETADTGSNFYVSLAFDDLGDPAVSYYNWEEKELRFARKTDSVWTIQVVDGGGEAEVGLYTSLAFDALGHPAMSYLDRTNGYAKFARWNGTTWGGLSGGAAPDIVDSDNITAIDGTSLTFDSTGNPAISYGETDLKYVPWNGSDWDAQIVNTGAFLSWPGIPNSLGFDPSDNPVIAYLGPGALLGSPSLNCAGFDGADWKIQTVDTEGSVGSSSSLRLGASEDPAIAYYDSVNGNLKYASWTGSNWDIQTVDEAGDVGMYCSLAFDASGNPAISYHEYVWLAGNLKYAKWNGSSWDVQYVDTVGNVGVYTSLAFDAQDNPAISYVDWTDFEEPDFQLKYARWNGSSWSIEAIDSETSVFYETCLAFDPSGNPAISYHADGNEDLKYARWNGSSWDIQVVDSEGKVGRSCSLVFDPEGHPAISYVSYYDSPERVKYAYWNGASWDVADIEATGDFMGWDSTSLAFGSDGNPVVAHGSCDLSFAWWDGSSWCSYTFEGYSCAGKGCTIVVGASGEAGISYFDSTNGSLKYARGILDQPPSQPVNISPSSGSWIPEYDVWSVVLRASAFADPEGDSHGASQWQVTAASGDYSNPVFDSGRTEWQLTEIEPYGLYGNSTLWWRVRYQDRWGAWSDWSAETSIRFDYSAPTMPSVTDDGELTSNYAELHAIWNSTDAESGIAEYQYAIGTTYGGTNMTDWTAAGTNTQVTKTGLGLAVGTTYYFSVKAKNGAGTWSNVGVSDGISVAAPPDATIPTTPVVTSDGATTTSTSQLHASWSSSDPESGVSEYQYAIGSTPGGTDVLAWTSVGTSTEVTKNGLNLTVGSTYYLAVKAKNGQGLWSGVGLSDGIQVVESIVPPAVTTNDASYLTIDSSRFNGTLTGLGTASSVTVSFMWGTSSGSLTNETAGKAMTSTGTFYSDLASLTPGTTYYYKAKAVGHGTPVYGAAMSFSTGRNPELESLDPAEGERKQQLTVTITGDNLHGATGVDFGSAISVEGFSVVSNTQISAEIAIDAKAAKGTRDVSVTTAWGTATKTEGFTVVGGGGGVCSGGSLAAPGAPSEMTTVLAALGLLLGAAYLIVRRGRRSCEGQRPDLAIITA